MTPTIGRTVIYTLTEDNAAQINRRRTTGVSIAERIKVLAWACRRPGAYRQQRQSRRCFSDGDHSDMGK